MPGGALLQLVAFGAQDSWLVSQPEVSFFKQLYKKHSNFALEDIRQTFNGSPNWGGRSTVIVSRNGDLLTRAMLEIDFPAAPSNHRWVSQPGLAMIDRIDLECGGQKIDTLYGTYMDIRNQLFVPESKQQGLGHMLSKASSTGLENPGKVYIDLPFFFSKVHGSALPLIALQYHQVQFVIYWKTTKDCLRSVTDAQSANADAVAAVTDAQATVDSTGNSLTATETARDDLEAALTDMTAAETLLGNVQTTDTEVDSGTGVITYDTSITDVTLAIATARSSAENANTSATYAGYDDEGALVNVLSAQSKWDAALLTYAADIGAGLITEAVTIQFAVAKGALADAFGDFVTHAYNAEQAKTSAEAALTAAEAVRDANPTAITTFANPTESIDFPKVGMYCTYVFLDTVERRSIASRRHEFLIEQVQFTGEVSVSLSHTSTKDESHTLNLNHPVKELLVVAPTSSMDTAIDPFQYGASPLTEKNWANGVKKPNSPFASVELMLNGHQRQAKRPGAYYEEMMPFYHHTRIPDRSNIMVIPFSLTPERLQPSGTCNFSRIDNSQLKITYNQLESASFTARKLHVYAINYNVLVVVSGMAGVSFSN